MISMKNRRAQWTKRGNIFADQGGEENFKLCRKTVGKFHVMPDKNFI